MPAFAFAYTYFGDSVVSTVMLVAKIILTLRHSGRALRGWIETENELKGLVSDLIHLTALHWQAEALLAPFVAARIYHEVARCHLVMTRFLAKISDSQGTVQRLLWAVSEEREFAAFKMQIIERRTVLGVILGLINSGALVAVLDRIDEVGGQDDEHGHQHGESGLERQLVQYTGQIVAVINRVPHGVSDETLVVLSPSGVPISIAGAYTSGHLALFNQRLQKGNQLVEWVYSDQHPFGDDADAEAPADDRFAHGNKSTPVWAVQVLVDGQVWGMGKGNTKKAARSEAAKQGLVRMGVAEGTMRDPPEYAPADGPSNGPIIFPTAGADSPAGTPIMSEEMNPEEIKTRTFTIFSPDDERPNSPKDSFTSNDLACVQAHLGTGGCLMSIYEPTQAASWLEDNWDSPLLTSIQNSGCGGPLAWMLSPTEPALAIFGYYDNPVVVNIAESLAGLSGFPVVIRSPSDNPALTLLANEPGSDNVSVQLGNTTGNADEGSSNGNDENEAAMEGARRPGESGDDGRGDDDLDSAGSNGYELNTADDHEPSRSYMGSLGNDGGGDGDGGRPTTMNDWKSQLHRTRVKLRLKLNTGDTYAVTICSTFKFIINRETEVPIDLENMSPPLSRPEIIALVDFEIETRPRETQVDRSYASIGFVVHRKESIIQRKFLARGFEHPEKLYTRGRQHQTQRRFVGALGFSDGSPLATGTFSYNRSSGATLEATDSKVMPRCRVDYETGDEWDEDNKSYSSYNVTYQLQDIGLDTEQSESHPLEVRVGMGINLRPPGSEKPLPQISFVNRNQVLIWVSDPTSRARIRGIVVLMSSYLDNVRTEETLSIYEQEEIEMSPGPLNVPKSKKEETKPGTISLSVAQVPNPNPGASSSNKFGAAVPAFLAKFGQRSAVSPVTYIPPHEYLARGWDANNSRWRSVLWPALDKHFRSADLERTSPVWKIQHQWKQAQSMTGKSHSQP